MNPAYSVNPNAGKMGLPKKKLAPNNRPKRIGHQPGLQPKPGFNQGPHPGFAPHQGFPPHPGFLPHH